MLFDSSIYHSLSVIVAIKRLFHFLQKSLLIKSVFFVNFVTPPTRLALTENFTTKRLIERLQNELRSNCRQKNVDGVLAVIELQIFTVANGDLRFTVVLFSCFLRISSTTRQHC